MGAIDDWRIVESRKHIRLGTASLALGGVAFALIQVLQASIGQFNPRPVVSVLIAVCVAVAGSALGRARQCTLRNRRLSSLVRQWPLPQLDDCDGLMLGVFPARRLGSSERTDALPPYVPRGVDDRLRRALGAGGLVLVVGPPRAGKSRTALEAARAAAGSRRVIVPVDGTALGDLADEGRSGFGAGDVWWLDDLERYLDDMGGAELSALLDDGLTVVATLRDEPWQALLAAGGAEGERGRRLRGGAQVFRLPAELSDAEAADMNRLLGDLDVSDGFGATLSASANGEVIRRAAPRPAPRVRPDPAGDPGFRPTPAL